MKLDFSLLEGLELSGVEEPSDASWHPGLIRMAAEGIQKRLVKKKNHARTLSQTSRIQFFPLTFAYIKRMCLV